MFFINFLSRLPLFILYQISNLGCFILYYVIGYRKKVVFDNLTQCFPEKPSAEIKNIAKKAYRNLTDVAVEVIKGKTISQNDFAKRVQLRNEELLIDYLKKGQSVLVLTSHYGNWEWTITATATHLSRSVYGVYRPLAQPFFDSLMLNIRSRFGGRPIPEKTAFREIVGIKDPKVIGIIADQTPNQSQKQAWFPFLGRDTNFFVGTEKIAQLLNYPVLFAAMRRVKRGFYTLSFELLKEPPYHPDSYEITEKYAKALERLITEYPANWLWSHKRWKHKRQL